MTKTLFLHAGPPKTGSTAIQTFIRDHAGAFAAQGLYWPKTGTEIRSHYHRALIDAFHDGHKQAPMRDKLAAELRGAGLPERVFLSAEMFASRLGQRAYFDTLVAFCASLGYRLHVILYIRPQSPLLNSLYTQHVKNWRPAIPMARFLEHQMASGRHDYASLFATLLDDPGVDATFRPFNAETLMRGIEADVLSALGLAFPPGATAQPRGSVNASPGPRTVAAFLQLRRRVTRELKQVDAERLRALTWPLLRAADALGWNADKYGGITAELHDALSRHYAAANDAFARRAWGKAWGEVFAPGECLPPSLNVFDPAEADASVLNEFKAFVEESFESIEELAGLHHGHFDRT